MNSKSICATITNSSTNVCTRVILCTISAIPTLISNQSMSHRLDGGDERTKSQNFSQGEEEHTTPGKLTVVRRLHVVTTVYWIVRHGSDERRRSGEDGGAASAQPSEGSSLIAKLAAASLYTRRERS